MSYVNIPIAFLHVTFAFIAKTTIYVIHNALQFIPIRRCIILEILIRALYIFWAALYYREIKSCFMAT